jgi:hypothetical protein
VTYGVGSDIPLPGDYDGNGGLIDLAVFRPSQGLWYINTDRNGASNKTVQYGTSGDVPLRENGWILQAMGILQSVI